ncbi:hypothetical protein KGQ64_17200 [bacterium]|nr:hypothetical protein [bacterium]
MRTANMDNIGGDWPETTILPEQHFGDSGEGSPLRGVKGLLIAILEDAIVCLEGAKSRCAKTRMAAVETLRWVRSTDTSYAFAFESVCDVLGLDVDRMRDKMLSIASAEGDRKRVPSARRVEANLSKITAPRVRNRRPAVPAAETAPAPERQVA